MMDLKIRGKFYNGKERVIGCFSPKGLEYRNQFDVEDRLHLERQLEGNYAKNFNWCIANNKFKSIEMTFYGDFCNNAVTENEEPIKFKFDLELTVTHRGAVVRNGRIEASEIIEFVNVIVDEVMKERKGE